MNDELEKYFAGTLSATEKTEFLNKLRDNPEAKKEFARMKAVWAGTGRRPSKDCKGYSRVR